MLQEKTVAKKNHVCLLAKIEPLACISCGICFFSANIKRDQKGLLNNVPNDKPILGVIENQDVQPNQAGLSADYRRVLYANLDNFNTR